MLRRYLSALLTCAQIFFLIFLAHDALSQRVVSTKTESYNENPYSSATKTTTVTADDFGVETTTIEIRDANNTLREKHEIKKAIEGDKVQTVTRTTIYTNRGKLRTTMEQTYDQNGKPISGTSYTYDDDEIKTDGTKYELGSDGRYKISMYNGRKDQWREVNVVDEQTLRVSNQRLLNLFGPHLAPQPQTAPEPPAPKQAGSVSYNPFAKGNYEIGFTRNVNFSFLKESQDGQKTGTEKEAGLNLSATYFFVNNFGIGASLRYDWSKSKNGNEITTSDMSGYLNATYGYPITSDFGIYGQVGFGIGKSKARAVSATNSVEESGNIFNMKFEIGAPFRLYDDVFVGPQLSYYRESIDYDQLGELNENGLRFSINLRSYLRCDGPNMLDGSLLGPPNLYQQGNSFFGVYTRGAVSTGNYEWTQNNNVDEEDYFKGSLMLDYNYYVLPHLAVGAEVRLSTGKEENKAQNQAYRQFSYTLMPQITFNAPIDELEDFFLTAGVGVGRMKTTNEIGANSFEQKDKLFTLGGGVGYNFFFSNKLSLTPMLRYDCHSRKDDQSGEKIRSRGISGEIGIRSFF